MAKSLVIVESPAKAKTINKYLGADFIVDASVGHVKDLPRNGLSIDIEGGFVPTYETIRGKEDVIARLRSLAGRCDRVYIATDPDREGEAIASHIAEEIGDRNANITRVVFNEITQTGVTNAMRSPREIDRPMVQAQEARRVMDRLIGYKVSPFLWSTFRGESRGLSAGRVQSVALRLVVERERAIGSFVPIDFWSVTGKFVTTRGDTIRARLVKYDGFEIRNPGGSATESARETQPAFISTKQLADDVRERAMRESYAIGVIARKEVRRNAPAPFTTSTLQQDAGKRLKMATRRTMQIAQKLYEGVDLGARGRVGLITYMRTDSVRVSDEAMRMAEEYVFENFGKEYLPPARKTFAQKSANVQDAHEAIRPTDLKVTPRDAKKHLDADAASLYELIWSRFVASQMAAAIIDQTSVDIDGGPFRFRATGRITRFRGWMQAYGGDDPAEADEPPASGKGSRRKSSARKPESDDELDNEERALPDYIRSGDSLSVATIEATKKSTKPPPRYTESLLVKEMEARGIGRPSTYASIIATIQDRGYVEQRQRQLHATQLGMDVCDALVAQFPSLFDIKFTARMEGELDKIAGGTNTYIRVLEGFYAPFAKTLRALPASVQTTPPSTGATSQRSKRKAAKVEGVPTDEKCGRCGAPMEKRNGRYGAYLACTAFPSCRNIVSVDAKPRAAASAGPTGRVKKKRGSKSSADASSSQAQQDAIAPCSECGSPMLLRRTDSGEFYGCSSYPTCRHTRAVPLGLRCPQCNEGDVVQRKGGRYDSVFFGCTRYPECRFTSSHRPIANDCRLCGNRWLVEIDSPVDGKFLECPKCRRRN